jgi:hypothetical protein
MNDSIVDTCLQMLPVVCVGGDTSFEFETHAVIAAIDQKVDFGASVCAQVPRIELSFMKYRNTTSILQPRLRWLAGNRRTP